MADAVGTQTIQDGDHVAIMKFTNISDGSGESAVLKVDVSALEPFSRDQRPCTNVAINRAWYVASGMTVDLLWDATTPVLAWHLDGDNYIDFRPAPLLNNAGNGVTGDIKFTTVGHTSGDRYSIMLELRKGYAQFPPSED